MVNGFYQSYTYGGGWVYLRAGEVWKYGETIHGDTRYSNAWLEDHNLEKKTQAVGPQREMKKIEIIKIYKYYLRHRHLPPGNKIFR